MDRGCIIVPIEVDADVVEFLVRTEWLTEVDAHNRRTIGRAIAALMKDTAKNL